MNNRGETLMELIVSVALLFLMVTMLVTVFQASANSLYNTMDAKRSMNTQVLQLSLEEEGTLETGDTLEIWTQYTVDGTEYSRTFETQILKHSQGSLYKFK